MVYYWCYETPIQGAIQLKDHKTIAHVITQKTLLNYLHTQGMIWEQHIQR